MKKLNAALLAVMLVSFISCGGGGSGGGDSGTYVLQAKQVAISGAHAAIAAMMVSTQGAFDSLKSLPPQNQRHDFSAYYSSEFGGGGTGGDDVMTGNYVYSYTQTLETYNLSFPQNNPIIATSTLAGLQSTSFTIPSNTTDSYAPTMSTATDNLLANNSYGAATFSMDEQGNPLFTAIDVRATDISVTNMVVTLADASTGTISFSSQQATISVGSAPNSMLSEVTEMVSTVVYSGETYTCTISAERESTVGVQTPTFNVSSASCHI